MNNEEKRNEGIQRFLNNMVDTIRPVTDEEQMIPMGAETFAQFSWSKPGLGFGSISFYEMDGTLYCDNECMSKEFIKERLCKMVDNSTFEDDK